MTGPLGAEAPRVYVDVGDVSAKDPAPVAVWDTALWDDPGARWAGTLPNFVPVTCRVLHVRCAQGRLGPLDTFTPGSATIDVTNEDGWATWAPTSPTPVTAGSWIRIRADTTTLWTGTIRKIEDSYVPGVPNTATIVAVDTLAALGAADWTEDTPIGAGDTAPGRVGRLCDLVDWPAELRRFDADAYPLAAFVASGNLLDLAQQATVTAGGALFADRDGALVWHGKDWLRTAPRSSTTQALVTTDPADQPPPPLPVPTNVANPPTIASVETALGSWGQANANTSPPVRTSARARDGTWSVEVHSLTGAANSPNVLPEGSFANPFTPVTAGTVYTIWASVYPTDPTVTAARLTCTFYDGANTVMGSGGYTPPAAAAVGVWTDYAFQVTAPAGAVKMRSNLYIATPAGSGVGPSVYWDRYGVAAGAWSTADWVPPGYTPPAPDPWTPQLCPVAMTPNGPDVDRVITRATFAGTDAGTDPPTTVEVVDEDLNARAKYRVQTFNVTGLHTTDAAQLHALAQAALAQRSVPRPRLDSLSLSPIADPPTAGIVDQVRIGDRLAVHYRHPDAGWTWAFQVHVHGVAHDITPAGADNRAAGWTVDLNVADATAFGAVSGWDLSAWDSATWAASARSLPAGDDAAPAGDPALPNELRHSDEKGVIAWA